jgi:hypothetical protein
MKPNASNFYKDKAEEETDGPAVAEIDQIKATRLHDPGLS